MALTWDPEPWKHPLNIHGVTSNIHKPSTYYAPGRGSALGTNKSEQGYFFLPTHPSFPPPSLPSLPPAHIKYLLSPSPEPGSTLRPGHTEERRLLLPPLLPSCSPASCNLRSTFHVLGTQLSFWATRRAGGHSCLQPLAAGSTEGLPHAQHGAGC